MTLNIEEGILVQFMMHKCAIIRELVCIQGRISLIRWPITAIPCINFADASILRNSVIPAEYLWNSIDCASLWSSGRQCMKLPPPVHEVAGVDSCRFRFDNESSVTCVINKC